MGLFSKNNKQEIGNKPIQVFDIEKVKVINIDNSASQPDRAFVAKRFSELLAIPLENRSAEQIAELRELAPIYDEIVRGKLSDELGVRIP
jgi:hypothetical protein